MVVRDFVVFFGDVQRGQVEKDGRFNYSAPNKNFPGVLFNASGELGEKAGSGAYISGACSGSITLTREHR